MEYQHGQIAEYGQVTRDQMSKVTRLDAATNGRREFTLNHHSIGFECAGSVARFNGREVYSVRFEQGGATHGRRFLNEAAARELFTTWTTEAA